eukprot:scaffold60333_cov39-Tisochrysis_lutea.AAC.2
MGASGSSPLCPPSLPAPKRPPRIELSRLTLTPQIARAAVRCGMGIQIDVGHLARSCELAGPASLVQERAWARGGEDERERGDSDSNDNNAKREFAHVLAM